MEYWNSLLTEKSWEILKELRKEYNFILIGGWAVYLWTKAQKSKDIDIVVNINELQKLKNKNLSKNDNLKKYEIKGEIDIDIYVEYYSKLPIPVEKIKDYSSQIEGFNVINKEALLILKQGAEIERHNSIKGEKDRLDIISLVFFSDINFRIYKSLLQNHSLNHLLENLIQLITNFKDYQFLSLSPREFKLKKQKIIAELKKLN